MSSTLSDSLFRDLPLSLVNLSELLEDKVNILHKTLSADEQRCDDQESGLGLWTHVTQGLEFISHLRELQKKTDQEVSQVQQQLKEVKQQQELLKCELTDLEKQRSGVEKTLRRSPNSESCSWLVRARRELQRSIAGRAAQADRLVFQEQALTALQDLLSEDARRYAQEAQRLHHFSHRVANHHRQGKNQPERNDNMEAAVKETKGVSGGGSKAAEPTANGAANGPAGKTSDAPVQQSQNSTKENEELETDWRAKARATLAGGPNLTRTGSVKNLVHKFTPTSTSTSTSSSEGPPVASQSRSLPDKDAADRISSARGGMEADWKRPFQFSPATPNSSPTTAQIPVPFVKVTPPLREAALREAALREPKAKAKANANAKANAKAKAKPPHNPACPGDSPSQKGDSHRESVADSGIGSESDFDLNNKSPPSEEEASAPKVRPNPKYQLFLGSDMIGNGSRDPDGPAGENGPSRVARWESTNSRFGPNYRGSLESLASRDWDTMSDRLGGYESPPRVFHSPYTAYPTTTTSTEYNPMSYKMQEGMSPGTSELNLFSYNSRSISPVPSIPAPVSRSRFSTYDTLRKKAEVNSQIVQNHLNKRPSLAPNKRDYIEELTRQMDTCQKRNQFLEAESVEMDKERNQIRFEMRGLLVNNEDLLRTNTQLQGEMKRMRERMLELERDNTTKAERFRQMETELHEAREVMVEANTQEYAFNFLQQSLKNKIQDAEEALEKQALHAQAVSEKLWVSERKLEELEVDKETRDKKTSGLSNTVFRLETELGDALLVSTQASAELSLQQKLREDASLRVDELEESLLEKTQELERLQQTVSRLQGEVSGKLIDKEQSLEEEIQLRERVQLQWKQAERTVEDLQMELQTLTQSKEDLGKQLKQAQEKIIEIESDLEDMHDNEQRLASKHKRATEQTEQLQLKLLQEKDINDQLDCEKVILERQIRDLRAEVADLQTNKVQEDVISKTEIRAKELESALRSEERNKVVLTNTIGKLERKINELSDQVEEEHKIAVEQKDLMTQRMRSLKRQLNEAEEESGRREGQYRLSQRELMEERETSSRLQRQLLDQHLQSKRKESMMMRQTLDNLRLDLSVDEEEDEQQTTQQRAATKV